MATKTAKTGESMGWRRWIACCGASCLAISHGVFTQPAVPVQEAALSANYTYTVIDRLLNCSGAGSPVIGNNGDVAFIGHCDGTQFVRRGDGVTTIDIYRVGVGKPYSMPDTIVSINDDGTVAFGGGPIGGGSTGYTILVGSGGPLTVAADTSVQTQWSTVARPSINNSAVVAFMAVASGTGSFNTVIRADGGGTFTTIAEPGDPAGAETIFQAFEPALNNAGQVEFLVNTTSGAGGGIFRGSGGALTKIVIGGVSSFVGINDAGRVGFAPTDATIRTGAGGALTLIAAPSADFLPITSVVAINNSNAVAFQAQTPSGMGIFVGDGVATQPVVQPGDVIPGLGAVTFAAMTEEAINDAGQVAFTIQYNDGEGLKSAIVRADPILPQVSLKVAATATGCKKVNATVTLDRPAPPGGVVIDLSDTNPAASVPASLKIASTKTSGKFAVAVTPVLSKVSGAITATVGSSIATTFFAVVPISVASLALTPNPVVGGNPVAGTATLDCAASNDITVALSSTKPSIAQPAVPSLLLPAGTRTMNFQVNTSDVTLATTAKINATANGVTKSKKLAINP
jgi:hypothetical protein